MHPEKPLDVVQPLAVSSLNSLSFVVFQEGEKTLVRYHTLAKGVQTREDTSTPQEILQRFQADIQNRN
jgi:hypothetical protein